MGLKILYLAYLSDGTLASGKSMYVTSLQKVESQLNPRMYISSFGTTSLFCVTFYGLCNVILLTKSCIGNLCST